MSWGIVGAAAIGAGSSYLSGRKQKKAAKSARGAQLGAIEAAEGEYRTPSEIYEDVYGELYGPKTQDIILGAERRLMPQYQELQFERMGMLQPELMERQREFQEAELELLGAIKPKAKEVLGDPRLERIAEISMEQAERLSGDLAPSEAEQLLSERGLELAASTGELTPLEARRAQQSARAASAARGRELDKSSLYGEMSARMAEEMDKREREIALGSQLLRQQAGMEQQRFGREQAARSLAGQAAIAAKVDPYALLGRTPSAYQTATGLSLGPLGGAATSPGLAYNIGSQEDYRRAQAQLSLGGIESAYQQAKGGIEAGMISGIGSAISGGITGYMGQPSFGGTSTPMASPTTQYSPFTTNTLGSLTGQTQLTGFMGRPF